MAKQNRNTLKGHFETGKKPTEGQYANLIDSFVLLDGENTGSINFKGDTNLNGDLTVTEITASGIISSSGNVIADQFVGDGRLITGITSSLINISAQTASLGTGSLLVSGTLFHSSASATIRLGIETTGSIIPEGNGTFDLGSPTNHFKDSFVSRSHALNVTATDINANKALIGIITASENLIATGHISASNIISSGHITASGDISASGNIFSKGLLSTDGNSTFGNEEGDTHTFNGHITASHDVSSSGEFIGASANITNVTASIISSSNTISAVTFTGIFNGALSSSNQIATAITGAFAAPSASISTRLTTAETELAGTLISSSDQIATPISGAFTAPSASISTRLTTAETELAGTLISSSDQIATPISGAFTAPSASISTRLTTAETELAGTLVSSSNQIATAISGALGTNATLIRSLTAASITGSFTEASSSFSTRVASVEAGSTAKTLVSSSNQIAAAISGALSNAAISALDASIVSSSDQIATPISGAFVAPSASFSTRLTTAETELAGTLVSSSNQIATAISGAFTLPSASISTRLTTAETELAGTLISSSDQIATEITGAFTAPSASISTRLTTAETELAGTLVSSSAQIADDISGSLSAAAIVALGASIVSSSNQIATPISGAFVAPSASFSTRLTTAETELAGTLISSSDQIAAPISGAFVAPSASISTRLTTAETELAGTLVSSSAQIASDISGALSTTAIAALGGGYYSSSLQTFTNITASGNVSASGNLLTSGNVTALGTGSFVGGIDLEDNQRISVGTGNDLEIYHTGTHSFIVDSGTGDLKIFGNNIELGNTSGVLNFKGISGGASNVYHNGSAKLATTSTGINVIGDITASGLISASGDLLITGKSLLTGDVTASGNISASGTVFASKFESAGTAGETISFNDNIDLTGHLTASGNVSASGVIATDLSVGEGLTSFPLSVVKDGSALGENIARFKHLDSANKDPFIIISSTSTGVKMHSGFSTGIDGSYEIQSNGGQSYITFNTDGDNERVRITAAGNVGIGNTAPTEKLTVEGNISSSGAINTLSHITASGNISSSGNLSATGDLTITGKSHFTGHVTASGNISASGNIITTGNVEVGGIISNVNTTNVTASGHISSSGNILGSQALQILGDASFRNVKPREIATTITGEITASNGSKQITGSGTLFTTELKVGDAFKITSASVEEIFTIENIVDNFSMSLDDAYSGGDVTGSHTGSIDGDLFNVVTSDDESRLLIDNSGDIVLFGTISSSGGFTGSSVTVTGDVRNASGIGTASFGRIDATTFHGDGAGITGVTAEWDGSLTGTATITGSLGMSGSITQVDGNITTDYINSEKIFVPGQGVGTMQIGSTFGVGESLDVVGNIHASNKVFASGFTTDDTTTGVVGIVSSSAQIASEISGALSNTAIATLNAGIVSGSSESFNFSGSITASKNISASGEFLAPSANIINITSSQAISSSGIVSGLSGSFTHLEVSQSISASGILTVGTITPDTITNVNTTLITSSIVSASTHVDTLKVKTGEIESTGSLELDSSSSITLSVSTSLGATNGGHIFIKDGAATQIHITGSEVRTTSNMVLSSSGDISLLADGNDITFGGDGKGFLKYSHDLPGTDDVTIANIQPGDVIISSSNGLFLDAAGGNLLFKDNAVTSITFNTTAGHITASGDISASGDLEIQEANIRSTAKMFGNAILNGNLTSSGDISSSGNISATGTLTAGSLFVSTHITASGNVSSSGTIFANNVTAIGTGSFTGGVDLLDNQRISVGTGNDLEIYHDGSNSYLHETGTGDLILKANNVKLTSGGGEVFIDTTTNGSVDIYHDNVKKLETTSTGINVTGDVTASGHISSSAASTITVGTGSFGIVSGSIISGTFVGDGSGLTGASVPAGTISSSKIYNTFYISGSDNYTSGSSSTELLGLSVTGSIQPGQTNKYDLGSPTHVWRDLWLSENSLKFVSSSGKIDRFEQRDLEDLKRGKPLDLEAAVEGFTKLNRPEAVMSSVTDKTYMDLNSAGRFKFKVGDDSTTPVDMVDFRFADGGDTVAKNFIKLGQGTTDISISGSFLTTNASITASAVNGIGGSISASGTITGESGSFNRIKVGTIVGTSPVTFTDNIIVPSISASGDLTASGTIQGLTGSFVHFVAPTLSNVVSSTHITASGNISASGNIFAEDFYIGNEQFTDNSAATGNFNIGASGAGSLILKHISASGNISGSATSTIETGGDITGFDLIAKNDITASGNISSSKTLISNTIEIKGGALDIKNAGAQSYARFYCESNNAHYAEIKAQPHALFSGNVTTLLPAYSFDFAAPHFQANVTASGHVSASGTGSFTGGIEASGATGSFAYLKASGDISASGTVFADNFQSAGGDDQITFTDNLSLTGHFTASGNISASGNIINTGNITNDGHITTTHVTASGDVSASGTIQGLTGSFSHLAGQTSFSTVTQTTSSITFLTSSTGVITSSVTFVPNVTNTFDLGSSTKQFKDIYIDGTAHIDNIADTVTITTASFGKVSSSLLPDLDDHHDLGSSALQWKDLYVDGTGNIDIISSSTVAIMAVSTTASLHTSGAHSKVLFENLPTTTNGATTLVMDSSGQLFQSSNISASGFISTETSVTASIISASSTVTGISGSFVHLDVLGGEITSSGNIINTGFISTTNITASGNISSSGNIEATTGTGSFGRIHSPEISSSGTVQGFTGSFTYAVIPTISSSGTITAEHFFSSDDAEIADTLTVTTIANVNTTHITASGDISASGTINAQNIIFPSSSEDLGNTATASLSTYASFFSTGQAETATLENGVEGQTKVFAMRSDGGNMVITVRNAGWKTSGDGQITFDTLGDACTLQYIDGHWFCIGNNGCTFA